MGRPATSTWSTDFLLREGFSREEIGAREAEAVDAEPTLRQLAAVLNDIQTQLGGSTCPARRH